jgi:hypothetical protein
MSQNALDPVAELQKEIEKEIKRRRTYESWDFKLAHFFLWLSILASFGASIIVAADVAIDKIAVAIIAGIPGLIILIDKSFDFAKRAVWGAMYRIELEELKDELVFKKTEPYAASKKFRDIKRKNEFSYSRIGFFSQKKIEQKHVDATGDA